MAIKTNLKAGGIRPQHNQAHVRSLRVKTAVRAGALTINHNEVQVADRA